MQLNRRKAILAIYAFNGLLLDQSTASSVDTSQASLFQSSLPLLNDTSLSLAVGDSSSLSPTLLNGPLYDAFPPNPNANPTCDALHYGQGLDRSACMEALQKIGSSIDTINIAARGKGRRNAMLLPNRWSSSK